MKILLLGPHYDSLGKFIEKAGDSVCCTQEKIKIDSSILSSIDFIVSYGYSHIITEDVISKFPKKIINLHISFLPFNRGADPNLWSFLEDTPKGVTIHYIDKNLDTGEILVQSEAVFDNNETLATTYQILSATIENLFKASWEKIKTGALKSYPQLPGGSFHRLKDKKEYEHLLENGWDTQVSLITGRALKALK